MDWALEKFFGLMNLSPPITKKNYQKVSKKLRDTSRDVAESSMLSAICEVKEKGSTYIGVSVDGTWQRGVFSPLNGVVVVVVSCCHVVVID